MSLSLRVHFLPELTTPQELAGEMVVVLDVLRASTSICCALAAGARAVTPCGQVDEARQLAARFSSGEALLGGERGGVAIDGFDLGNSPSEYTPERVNGRTIVFTTTNGTRALGVCEQAGEVLIGAAVNLEAVCRLLIERHRNESLETAHILCAGTGGTITREDTLVAGAIGYRLSRILDPSPREDDSAQIARAAWRAVYAAAIARGVDLSDHLAEELRDTQGGRNLMIVGHGADIAEAARIDRFDFVPRYDAATGRIEIR